MNDKVKYRSNPTPANNDEQLQMANEKIGKLEEELKCAAAEMLNYKDKVTYYKTILQKILDL